MTPTAAFILLAIGAIVGAIADRRHIDGDLERQALLEDRARLRTGTCPQPSHCRLLARPYDQETPRG